MIIYIVLVYFKCEEIIFSPDAIDLYLLLTLFHIWIHCKTRWWLELVGYQPKGPECFLNPPNLHAWKVYQLEGRSSTRISVRKGQLDFHTTWYISSRSRPNVVLYWCHAKVDLRSSWKQFQREISVPEVFRTHLM